MHQEKIIFEILIYICENGEYLASSNNDSVITCDEIVNAAVS